MAINWKNHKFDIEELAKQAQTNELVVKLCEGYAMDIGAFIEGMDKDSEDYQYFIALQKALNKIAKQYVKKQGIGAR